jgi:hypothetical protein
LCVCMHALEIEPMPHELHHTAIPSALPYNKLLEVELQIKECEYFKLE